MNTVADLFQRAVGFHQNGNIAEADRLYRQVLALSPNFADAHYNLGLVQQNQGQLADAIVSYRQVLRLNPRHVDARNNLGVALKDQGQPAEASACFRQVLQWSPNHVGAQNNLGTALFKQDKFEEAAAAYRQAIYLQPAFAEAHNNLGNALQALGRFQEAVESFTEALRLKPDFVQARHNLGFAHYNLGIALAGQRKLGEAAQCFHQTLAINAKDANAHYNLGTVLMSQGDLEGAAQCFRQTLDINSEHAQAHNNLGIVLADQGRPTEAIPCFQNALRIDAGQAGALTNMGNAFKDQGNLEEAVSCFRAALALSPKNSLTHSNLVYTLHFCPDQDARTLFEESQRWNQQHAQPLSKFILPHDNDKSKGRRLKIGYVSPDFSEHPIGRFMLPLLEKHDHAQFEIYCYSSVNVPDAVTQRCQAAADVWRPVAGFTDEELVKIIRQDRIDILVDLTMHTLNNRLLLFARKPAPVQVSYLAFCGTTGLKTMDYRLTDAYIDPPNLDDDFYSEQSIRLPATAWCYQPYVQTSAPAPLPALEAGHITFGCLNNFCKATGPTLETWRQIMAAMPQAHLLLLACAGNHRERLREFMAQGGVSPEHVQFVDKLPSAKYLRTYERIDVALDPFPFAGVTTTCDALWMGVPVVTLAGRTGVGRAGVSILSNVGLADLVAKNQEEYVSIAQKLARDLPRLSALRASLREQMQKSSLMDAPGFARNVEAAYRKMWQTW